MGSFFFIDFNPRFQIATGVSNAVGTNFPPAVSPSWCGPQVEAGADILQVFEAMGGFISEDHFYDRAMPYLAR